MDSVLKFDLVLSVGHAMKGKKNKSLFYTIVSVSGGQMSHKFWSLLQKICSAATSFGLPLGQNLLHSDLPDEQLDELVQDIMAVTPQSGVGLIHGPLRSRSYQIQRQRLHQALQHLDPVTSALRQSRRIIRRTYSVPGPYVKNEVTLMTYPCVCKTKP